MVLEIPKLGRAEQRWSDVDLPTQAVHAGCLANDGCGDVAPPIHLTTTFVRDPDGGYPKGFIYSRYGNPNRGALESAIATLEGGDEAFAFSSGQAAASAVFQTLRPGDHVIVADDVYFGNASLLRNIFEPWGLESSFVDLSDVDAVSRAIRGNTKLIWLETPSNPLLKITDIGAVARLAHQHEMIVACDSTWSTPVITRPLELGADVVVHSSTKYFGGHSDVMGGVAVVRSQGELADRLRTVQALAGGVPSPFDSWLILRGLRTLPLRVERQSATALELARRLSANPHVEIVHYPGLESHPGHAVAKSQMRHFGGMLSIQVAGDRDYAMAVVARCALFTRATSIGAVESLIEHRASNEPAGSTTPANLIRISVGIEAAQDLILDLEQALDGNPQPRRRAAGIQQHA